MVSWDHLTHHSEQHLDQVSHLSPSLPMDRQTGRTMTELGLYTVSQENDTDVAHYNIIAHQLILVIFGTDVADRLVIRSPTSPNKYLCTTWGNVEIQKLHLLSRM